MGKYRVFNGKKYTKASDGYYKSSKGGMLSRAIWNFYNPDDLVLDGEVVHHSNEVRDDDRIENYEKMTRGNHNTLHHVGEKNGGFRQSHCDWPGCELPHRRVGFCEKHAGVFYYHKRKGVGNIDDIIKIAYRPVNEYQKRNSIGEFC